MNYKRLIAISLILTYTILLNGQNINIIPKPKLISVKKGEFALNRKTIISFNDPQLKFLANYFGVSKLSFGSPDLLMEKMGLTP